MHARSSSQWALCLTVCHLQFSLLVIAIRAFNDSEQQSFIKGWATPVTLPPSQLLMANVDLTYSNGQDNDQPFHPLALPRQCELDAALIRTLLFNTICLFRVDGTKSRMNV